MCTSQPNKCVQYIKLFTNIHLGLNYADWMDDGHLIIY